MNNIVLHFDKSTTKLAGNPYGKSIYNEQIRDKIDYKVKNMIIFPDNIEKIASSFTQGLFSEIVKEVGYEGIEKSIKVKAKTADLEKTIYEDLLY